MTAYEQLLDDVLSGNISLVSDASSLLPASSFRGGTCDYIFFNEHVFQTDAARRVALAHEKGHCDTGAFYTLNTPLETRGRCEARAWRQAVIDLLPFTRLTQAFESCKTADGVELYDLAEYLDVTPDFVHRAIELYACLGKQILRQG